MGKRGEREGSEEGGGEGKCVKERGEGGGRVQITRSCFISNKYHSEVLLKIDTVKDRGVRGGIRNPW